MSNISNLTKKDIVKLISIKIGLSQDYSNKVVDNLLKILSYSINDNVLKVKNFGTFKTISKKERIGRNPKNNKTYLISARKSLSFSPSKNLSNKLNNL